MSVNDTRLLENLTRDMAAVDQTVNGMLVAVPFYNTTTTVKNNVITLFAFDALGTDIKEIFVSFYLVADVLATFTPSWNKTRAGDLVTFTLETIPAIATIVTPAANAVYSYKLGDLPQGLQGEFRVAQNNLGAATVAIDGFALVHMSL